MSNTNTTFYRTSRNAESFISFMTIEKIDAPEAILVRAAARQNILKYSRGLLTLMSSNVSVN